MPGNELHPFDERLLGTERPPILDLCLETYGVYGESALLVRQWEDIIGGVVQHNQGITPGFTVGFGGPNALRGRLVESLAGRCASIPGVHLAIEAPVPDKEQLPSLLGTLATNRFNTIHDRIPHVTLRPPEAAVSTFHLKVDHEGVCFWQPPGANDKEPDVVVLGNGLTDLAGTLHRYASLCARLVLGEVIAGRVSQDPSIRISLITSLAKGLYNARRTLSKVYGYDQSRMSGQAEREQLRAPRNLHLDLTGTGVDLGTDQLQKILGELRKTGLNRVRLRFSSAQASISWGIAEACQRHNLQLELIADELDLPEALTDAAHNVIIPVAITSEPTQQKLQPYTVSLFSDPMCARIQAIDEQLRQRQSSAALTLQLSVYAHNLVRLRQLRQAVEGQTRLSPGSIAIELIEPQPLRLTAKNQSRGEGFQAPGLISLQQELQANFREVHTRHWASEPGYQAVMDRSGNFWGFEARLSDGELVPLYYGSIVTHGLEGVLRNYAAHLHRIRTRRQQIETVRAPLGTTTADLTDGRRVGGIGRLVGEDALAAVFFGRTA